MDGAVVSLLYLDRFHLGDPLFLQALGRALARRDPKQLRPIIVHGQGEYVQRRLESEGLFLEMHRDVHVATTTEEARLIQTALRDLNRWLVGLLTEAVVPAVGFMGSDRGLLLQDDDRITVGRISWVERLLEEAVVPVIAATAAGPEGAVDPVDSPRLVQALNAHFGEKSEVVMFTTNNLGGIMSGRDPVSRLALQEVVSRGVLADPEAAETLVFSGARLLVTNTVRYPLTSGVRGTWVAQNSV